MIAHDPSYLPHRHPPDEIARLFPRATSSEPLWQEWYEDACGNFGPVEGKPRQRNTDANSYVHMLSADHDDGLCNVEKQRRKSLRSTTVVEAST